MFPFRSRMRDSDKMLLISALSSLAERLPGQIRVSLFSMDKQKELFHTSELSRQTFEQTIDKLNELELGTVDYSTLVNRTGHIALLTNLQPRVAEGRCARCDYFPRTVRTLGGSNPL